MEWHRINWKGPYAIDKALEMAESGDFGFYTIYEDCEETPEPKLLYIGEIYQQDFSKRIEQYKKERLDSISGTVAIHLGKIVPRGNKEISLQDVEDIEKCLIYIYRPLYNTVNKEGYTGRDVLIINTGKVGTIKKLVSNDTIMLGLLQ